MEKYGSKWEEITEAILALLNFGCQHCLQLPQTQTDQLYAACCIMEKKQEGIWNLLLVHSFQGQ